MISVQVVTWNSGAVIGRCLQSLAGQTSMDFEVIVVDNTSDDASVSTVAEFIPGRIPGELVRLTRNTGFCGGHNRAFEMARGDWILFLNPDTRLPPDFMEIAARVVERVPPDIGSVAPCILLPDGHVDSAGLFLDPFRRLYDRGRGAVLDERYLREERVLGGTGAVVLHRRRMLEAVAEREGPLDEGLFAYYDDLDLALRARLFGWGCMYAPELVAEHDRAGRNAIRKLPGRGSDTRAQVLTIRNRILVLAKCEPRRTLLTLLPRLVAFEAARVAYLTFRSPGALRGYLEAARQLPDALRRRRRLLERVGIEAALRRADGSR